MLKKIASTALLATSLSVFAQETPVPTIQAIESNTIDGAAGTGCVVANLQGAIAAGFLGWTPGDGSMAIQINPTGTGGAFDPGCGATLVDEAFSLTDVTFNIATEVPFGGPGDGIGAAQYIVSIHPFATPGDPLAGPGPAIASETVDFTFAGEAFLAITTPFTGVELTEPFFVAWTFVSFEGDDQVITPLWDGEVRPDGQQFVANAGAGFIDHSAFFAAPANGWVDVTVSGELIPLAGVELPPPPVVPTMNAYGMVAMALLLLIGGIFMTRRRA